MLHNFVRQPPCLIKSTDFITTQSFNHLIALSDVGSSPTCSTCETHQIPLASVLDGFALGTSPHELNFLNSLLTWLKLSYLVLKFGLTLNYCLIPSEHKILLSYCF